MDLIKLNLQGNGGYRKQKNRKKWMAWQAERERTSRREHNMVRMIVMPIRLSLPHIMSIMV